MAEAPFKRGDVVRYQSVLKDDYYLNGAIAVILGPAPAQAERNGFHVSIISAPANPTPGDEDEDWKRAPYFWACNIAETIGHIEVPDGDVPTR